MVCARRLLMLVMMISTAGGRIHQKRTHRLRVSRLALSGAKPVYEEVTRGWSFAGHLARESTVIADSSTSDARVPPLSAFAS